MPSLVRTCKWRVVGNEKLQNNPRRQYWRKVSGFCIYLRRGSALLQRSFFLIERRSHIPYNVFFSRSPTLMFPGYNVPTFQSHDVYMRDQDFLLNSVTEQIAGSWSGWQGRGPSGALKAHLK